MLLRMQCPSCNEEIDDGVANCPQCDAVVDPSAFDDSPRPSKPAAPRRPATKSGVKPVAKRPVSGAKKSVAKPKRPAPKPDAEEPLAKAGNAAGDWRSKVDPEDWNQMPASQREPAKFEADKGIVDVYWLRKSAASDQLVDLGEEKNRLLEELDGQFRIVRENLE